MAYKRKAGTPTPKSKPKKRQVTLRQTTPIPSKRNTIKPITFGNKRKKK